MVRISDLVPAFEALAHETRLAAFRLLIPAGPNGLPAGAISERLGLPPNALSFHLARLVQTELVTARRAGRQIFYAVEYRRFGDLVRFLVEDCCASAPSGCLPGCPAPFATGVVKAAGAGCRTSTRRRA